MTLPAGIYFRRGERPGAAFRVAFLRAVPGADASDVARDLAALWALLAGLARGEVPGLPGVTVPSGRLTAVLGVGVSAFDIPGALAPAPEAQRRFGRFLSPRPAGGGPLLFGADLRYDDSVMHNEATEHFAVQLIADTELAVSRAVVELHAELAARGEGAALALGRVYGGFQRDDGRSWLDFHDGLSNLRAGEERRRVIAIKADNVPDPADAWTRGGTYLVFIRVGVELARWRALSRVEQERLVGRDKLTGCAIERVGAAGEHELVPGCPAPGTAGVEARGNEDFQEPPDTSCPVIAASHAQRCNRHVGAPEHVNSLRVYRQGYEFFEPTAQAPGFRVGLNFVSFQDTPQRIVRMLTQPDWLGGVNFGGRAGEGPTDNPRLLHVLAAGTYLIPPERPGAAFPGATDLLPASRR